MSSMITKQVKITGLLSLNASAAIQGSAHKLYGGRVSAMKMFGWGFKEASNNRSMMMLCLKKINMEKRKSLNNNAVIFKSAFFQHKEQRGEEAEMRHQYWRASGSLQPRLALTVVRGAVQHIGYVLQLFLTETTCLRDKDIKPAGCEGSPLGSGLLLGSLEYLTFLIIRNEP